LLPFAGALRGLKLLSLFVAENPIACVQWSLVLFPTSKEINPDGPIISF
jgi:hypothetical protein